MPNIRKNGAEKIKSVLLKMKRFIEIKQRQKETL